MEQAGTLRRLELRVILRIMISLAVIRVELPHNVMLMKPAFCIRLLVALRSRVLHSTYSARGLIYPVCGALRLMKQAFLKPILALLCAAHAP